MSMAIRYDHGLGMPGFYDSDLYKVRGTHAQRVESTLIVMRQLWEEVVGQGFYAPEREDYYAGLAASQGEKASTTAQERGALDSSTCDANRPGSVPDEWMHNMLNEAVRAIEAGDRAAFLMNVEALKGNLRQLAKTYQAR